MQKKLISLFAIVFLMTAILSTASAQQKRMPEPKVGLSASFTGNSAIAVPVWVSQGISLVPMISFMKTDQVSSTLAPGVAVHVHTQKGRIRPYFGGQFMALVYSPNNGNSTTTMSVGGLFGADYYLHPMFAIGIESQLSATLENKDAYQPLQLSTFTVVKATVYIK
ncbi:MAG: hypothetical protein H6696_05145 [Deferribacteres bacterium]|nr:hypothetical protein [candidate division KSB1 bacterium]MCB9501303.1 hypothetical protein [Deferribacteres bacterium]